MLLDSKTELLSLHQMIPEIVSFCNFEFLFCPLFRQSLLAKRKNLNYQSCSNKRVLLTKRDK